MLLFKSAVFFSSTWAVADLCQGNILLSIPHPMPNPLLTCKTIHGNVTVENILHAASSETLDPQSTLLDHSSVHRIEGTLSFNKAVQPKYFPTLGEVDSLNISTKHHSSFSFSKPIKVGKDIFIDNLQLARNAIVTGIKLNTLKVMRSSGDLVLDKLTLVQGDIKLRQVTADFVNQLIPEVTTVEGDLSISLTSGGSLTLNMERIKGDVMVFATAELERVSFPKLKSSRSLYINTTLKEFHTSGLATWEYPPGFRIKGACSEGKVAAKFSSLRPAPQCGPEICDLIANPGLEKNGLLSCNNTRDVAAKEETPGYSTNQHKLRRRSLPGCEHYYLGPTKEYDSRCEGDCHGDIHINQQTTRFNCQTVQGDLIVTGYNSSLSNMKFVKGHLKINSSFDRGLRFPDLISIGNLMLIGVMIESDPFPSLTTVGSLRLLSTKGHVGLSDLVITDSLTIFETELEFVTRIRLGDGCSVTLRDNNHLKSLSMYAVGNQVDVVRISGNHNLSKVAMSGVSRVNEFAIENVRAKYLKFDFTEVSHLLVVKDCPYLEGIAFPLLQRVMGFLQISGNPMLEYYSFKSLYHIGNSLVVSDTKISILKIPIQKMVRSVEISNIQHLRYLKFPEIQQITKRLQVLGTAPRFKANLTKLNNHHIILIDADLKELDIDGQIFFNNHSYGKPKLQCYKSTGPSHQDPSVRLCHSSNCNLDSSSSVTVFGCHQTA
ncbi:hypothetical protein DSO57_1027785 [Entomophthora muscae]|uniref:Uncharacterized protein n=1 Tax=Entomophthora muscae TaxID=34485 RepID=A0ACC2SEH1_9FUNG|nr:hypothetical protein DSO57_1027785 [Entomophthora muscae]